MKKIESNISLSNDKINHFMGKYIIMCVSIWIPKIIIFPFAPVEKLIILDVSKFMCLNTEKTKIH